MNNLQLTLATLAASNEKVKDLENRLNALIEKRYDKTMSLKERAELSKTPEEAARREALESEITNVNTALIHERVKSKILKNNSYIDLMRDAWPYISAILTKYAGKKYGPKTSDKMRDELKAACNCTFYISGYGYDKIHVSKLNDQGYTCGGPDIEIYYKHIQGIETPKMLINNVIQPPAAEHIYISGKNNNYYTNVDKAVTEVLEAYKAVKKAANDYEIARKAYNVLHVAGLNEAEYLRSPYNNII